MLYEDSLKAVCSNTSSNHRVGEGDIGHSARRKVALTNQPNIPIPTTNQEIVLVNRLVRRRRRAKCAYLPRTIVESTARDGRKREHFRGYLADVGWRKTIAE